MSVPANAAPRASMPGPCTSFSTSSCGMKYAGLRTEDGDRVAVRACARRRRSSALLMRARHAEAGRRRWRSRRAASCSGGPVVSIGLQARAVDRPGCAAGFDRPEVRHVRRRRRATSSAPRRRSRSAGRRRPRAPSRRCRASPSSPAGRRSSVSSPPPPLPKMPPTSDAIATDVLGLPRLRHLLQRRVLGRQLRRVGERLGDVLVHAVDVRLARRRRPPGPRRRRCASACTCAVRSASLYGAIASCSRSIAMFAGDAPRNSETPRAAEVAQHVHQEEAVLGGRVALREHRRVARRAEDVRHAEARVADDGDAGGRRVDALDVVVAARRTTRPCRSRGAAPR